MRRSAAAGRFEHMKLSSHGRQVASPKPPYQGWTDAALTRKIRTEKPSRATSTRRLGSIRAAPSLRAAALGQARLGAHLYFCFWHLGDLAACPLGCPLLGVKRTCGGQGQCPLMTQSGHVPPLTLSMRRAAARSADGLPVGGSSVTWSERQPRSTAPCWQRPCSRRGRKLARRLPSREDRPGSGPRRAHHGSRRGGRGSACRGSAR